MAHVIFPVYILLYCLTKQLFSDNVIFAVESGSQSDTDKQTFDMEDDELVLGASHSNMTGQQLDTTTRKHQSRSTLTVSSAVDSGTVSMSSDTMPQDIVTSHPSDHTRVNIDSYREVPTTLSVNGTAISHHSQS